MVESHVSGMSMFMLAEVSNHDVEDMRAMKLEDTIRPESHKDLWDKVTDFTPLDPKDILRQAEPHELRKVGGSP